MPYYAHLKSVDVTGWTWREALAAEETTPPTAVSFVLRADAHAYVQAHTTPAAPWTLTFQLTEDEHHDWQRRERNRLRDGVYLLVPWAPLILAGTDVYRHYAHVSIDDPTKVAYTPTAEHGYQDRQIRVNPGRYLAEFYADLGADRIAHYAAMIQGADYTLHVAHSADDIERVYRGADYQTIPFRSCMGPDAHASFDTHPSRVYGDSDLGVAYIGPIDAVLGRCVVWPDRQIHSRIYGREQIMATLLNAAGYSSGSVDDARIRRIVLPGNSSKYVMPYIDGIDVCNDCGNGYLRLGEGSISTSNTKGYTSAHTYECEHCEREIDDSTYDEYDGYCYRCYSNRWTCDSCNDTFYADTESSNYVEGSGDYCDSCYQDRFTCCESCNEPYDTRRHDACPDCPDEDTDDDTPDDTTPDTPDVAPCMTVSPLSVWADAPPSIVPGVPLWAPVNPPEDTSVTGSWANAILTGFYAYATAPGTCRVYYCHKPIAPDDLFYAGAEGRVSYCRTCAETPDTPSDPRPRAYAALQSAPDSIAPAVVGAWYRERCYGDRLARTYWYQAPDGRQYHTHAPAFAFFGESSRIGDLAVAYERVPAPTTNRPPMAVSELETTV